MNYKRTGFQIERLPDDEIYQRMIGIIDDAGFSVESIEYTLLFSDSAQNVNSAAPSVELQSILQLRTVSLSQLRLTFNGCYIILERQLPPAPNAIPNTDTFSINVPTGRLSPDVVAKLIANCREKIRPIDSIPLESLISDDQRRHYEAREIALSRLERSMAEFEATLQKNVTENNAATRAEQERLRADYEAKVSQADSEFQSRLRELGERENRLADEKKQFDSRESRHVRRDLISQIQDLLRQRNTTFELTKGTKKQRTPIVSLYCTLILFFLVGTVWSYTTTIEVPPLVPEKKSSSTNSTEPPLILKDATDKEIYEAYSKYVLAFFDGFRKLAFPLGFVLSSGYFLRWLNRGYQVHAQEEFKLKRLELDIIRASWIVETALDWFDETEEPLPRYLADPITRGLFAAESQHEDSGMTAADSIASALFGNSAKAEVRLPHGKLLLDNRGIQKLKKKPKRERDDDRHGHE
jgi:hypothetical protein